MKNKRSNVKKEMLNVLQLLNEGIPDNFGETLTNKVNEGGKNIENKVNETKKNIENKVEELQRKAEENTKQSDEELEKALEQAKKQAQEYMGKLANQASNEWKKFTRELNPSFSNTIRYFVKDNKGSIIGAGAGAGITAAGWAAARAYLQKQLNDCETEVCRKEIKDKISKLNKLALLSGIGLTAIGAVTPPITSAIIK